MVGTPAIDAVGNVLSVPDLDYTVETKNVLIKLAKFIDRDHVREDLRQRIRIDLTPQIGRAKQIAVGALQRDVGPFRLNGTVRPPRLLGLWADPQKGVTLLTTSDGILDLVLR